MLSYSGDVKPESPADKLRYLYIQCHVFMVYLVSEHESLTFFLNLWIPFLYFAAGKRPSAITTPTLIMIVP